MNKFGFKLADVFIHGKHRTNDFTNLDSSVKNSCRGAIEYDMGPEYVFKIDRSFSDCNTHVVHNDTHATYENAIQGTIGKSHSIISRKVVKKKLKH